MEGDTILTRTAATNIYFNPLPPHGGRLMHVFLSLLLVLISIHSLRMEGDMASDRFKIAKAISIHSLRMEGDYSDFPDHYSLFLFQSTPSAWRETLVLGM